MNSFRRFSIAALSSSQFIYTNNSNDQKTFTLRKYFSSEEPIPGPPPTDSSIVSNFPSNLRMADVAVLEKPTIKNQAMLQNFAPIMYNYPTLNVPDSIPVLTFNDPLSSAGISAPMEKMIFEVAIRKDIIHDVIRYIRHKRRQPKRVKRVGEIRGSKKKPHAQKGIGRSQAGNKRNSSWVGGAKAHGPVLRDYSIRINRKQRALGMMMVIAAKYREGNLVIVDNLECETHKTKDLKAKLERHDLLDHTSLIVGAIHQEDFQENFDRAVGNIPNVVAMPLQYMNVYEIMKKEKLIFTQDCFTEIQRRLVGQYTYSGKRNTIQKRLELLETARMEAEAGSAAQQM